MLAYPPCQFCVHITADPRTTQSQWFCDAFPGGIPDEIRMGANLHTSPVQDDNGIQFELNEELADEFAEYMSFRDNLQKTKERISGRT